MDQNLSAVQSFRARNTAEKVAIKLAQNDRTADKF